MAGPGQSRERQGEAKQERVWQDKGVLVPRKRNTFSSDDAGVESDSNYANAGVGVSVGVDALAVIMRMVFLMMVKWW